LSGFESIGLFASKIFMYALASPYASLAIFERVSPLLTSWYVDSCSAPLATVSRSLTLATDETLPQHSTIFSLVAWSGATPLTVTVCDAPSYWTSRPSALRPCEPM
jgi:hypothetical protein